MSDISIQDFCVEYAGNAVDFVRWYTAKNKIAPDMFPLSLPRDNAGVWWEQAQEFDADSDDQALIQEEKRLHSRFFVDCDGVIYTIFPDGGSNFQGHYRIVEAEDNESGDYAVFQLLGEKNGDDGRVIEEEWVIWDSLMELGAAVI